MKKRYVYIIPIIIFLVIGIFLPVIFSHSLGMENELVEDNGYYINSYNVEIDVANDGVYTVREDIEVHFNLASQGIYRYLPVYQTAKYYDKSGNLVSRNYKNTISNFEMISSDRVSMSDEGDYKLYIFGTKGVYNYAGDERTYSFSYQINPGNDRDESMDMFYYNIIGTGWDTNINNVTFTINFEKEVEDNFKFYVGKYGESDVDSARVSHTFSSDKMTVTGTCSGGLAFGEAITTFIALPNGFFTYSRSYVFDFILLGLILISIGVGIYFYFKHRQKMPVIPVVNFTAPKGMTPTEVGYLNDEEITGDDLSALIVYWASSGYLKIVEKDKKITLHKLSDLPKNCKQHEKTLFDDMFRIGDVVSANNLNLSLNTGYKCANSVEREMASNFSNSKSVISKFQSTICGVLFALFMKNVFQSYVRGMTFIWQGLIYAGLLIMFGLVGMTIQNRYKKKEKVFWIEFGLEILGIYALLIALMIMFEGFVDPFYLRVVVAVLPALYVLVLLSIERYTPDGKKLLGQVRGLKAFIETAEKDRMEMLVSEDPSLFFEILPYAYVLGVSDVYMKKFENINIAMPDWYESSGPRFTYVHFVVLNNNFNTISNACTTRYRTQSTGSISSHSSSGFGGGGGFSGGGFGGGGGGRW